MRIRRPLAVANCRSPGRNQRPDLAESTRLTHADGAGLLGGFVDEDLGVNLVQAVLPLSVEVVIDDEQIATPALHVLGRAVLVEPPFAERIDKVLRVLRWRSHIDAPC